MSLQTQVGESCQVRFLAEIAGQIEVLTLEEIQAHQPTTELMDGEVVVGVMPIPVRALFCLLCKFRDKSERAKLGLIRAYIESSPLADLKAMYAEVMFKESEVEGVKDLCWSAVRAEFPEIRTKPRIGCAAGWQVYYSDSEDDNPHYKNLKTIEFLVPLG